MTLLLLEPFTKRIPKSSFKYTTFMSGCRKEVVPIRSRERGTRRDRVLFLEGRREI